MYPSIYVYLESESVSGPRVGVKVQVLMIRVIVRSPTFSNLGVLDGVPQNIRTPHPCLGHSRIETCIALLVRLWCLSVFVAVNTSSRSLCCCTASMEQATDGAETAAIDGLVSS